MIPDDTCYMIGFDNLNFAVLIAILLNTENCLTFLKSITFQDAKRVYTKDVLMRINLKQLLMDADKNLLIEEANSILKELGYKNNIDFDDVIALKKQLAPKETMQMSLFG